MRQILGKSLLDTRLFKIRDFEFFLHHLLVIGILVLSFSIAVMARSQSADYGFELDGSDPFYNYRATKFLNENGFDAYVNWHDDKSWYPQGRDIFQTSQISLHLTTSYLYDIFGNNQSLYDFTIIIPMIFSSLTTIAIFALMRLIGGTTAGLFASMFFAVAPLIIIRGSLGWFRSEPLGIFYGILAIYLILSGFRTQNRKIAFVKLVLGGIVLVAGISAWGGVLFFVIALGIFITILPFFKKEHSFLFWAIPLYAGVTILVGTEFIRSNLNFLTGVAGLLIYGPAILSLSVIVIQRLSKKEKAIRNSIIFLISSISAGIFLVLSNIIKLPSGKRYLFAINPFTEIEPFFFLAGEQRFTEPLWLLFTLSTLLPFAGLAIWLITNNGISKQRKSLSLSFNNEMIIFVLIFSFLGVYVGSTLVRLNLFAALAVIMLSSIGLAALTSKIFQVKGNPQNKTSKNIMKPSTLKLVYVIALVYFLAIPLSFPLEDNWLSNIKNPPSILSGVSSYNISTNDWPLALEWIKNNTEEDAVIAAWWDYGYWITAIGERTTLSDGATFKEPPNIRKTATMFLSSPEDGYDMLLDLKADHILIFVAGERIISDNQKEFFTIQHGGEISKISAISSVVGENKTKFLHDNNAPKKYFWENTFLGSLIPFTHSGYANLEQVNFKNNQFKQFPIYEKTIKYDGSDGPLKLVYSSPGFDSKLAGPFLAVLIYEVNDDYE